MENRELKFRAWDKQYKKMVEVTDLYFDTQELDYKGNTSEPKMMYHYEIMQYTNLQDKDKTEIFDGDLIQHEDGHICQVLYKNGSPQQHYLNGSEKGTTRHLTISANYCQVIGNIYTHPDLIK